MLRKIATLLLLLCCTACSGMKIDSETGKIKLPTDEREEATKSLDELKDVINSLNPKIGAYPPIFESAEDRKETYEIWLDAYLDAKVYMVQAGSAERVLWTMAELLRQGHNMDVELVGANASEVIEKCIKLFPRSIKCHFSSADYYLSIAISGESLAATSRSLEFLRKSFAPKVNESVEENFIYFYYYERQPELALKQIDRFLQIYPKSKKREKLLEMRNELTKDSPRGRLAAPKKPKISARRSSP